MEEVEEVEEGRREVVRICDCPKQHFVTPLDYHPTSLYIMWGRAL